MQLLIITLITVITVASARLHQENQEEEAEKIKHFCYNYLKGQHDTAVDPTLKVHWIRNPVYPHPSDTYPYDPYEPYDPNNPYPFQYCELNVDEYGRPYYGPYDRYLSKNSHPPEVPKGFPKSPPNPLPSGYPSLHILPYPSLCLHPYPLPTTVLPPPETYTFDLTKFKGTTLSLPSCIISNECDQEPESCEGSGTQYDSCDRRCTCKNGKLMDCCRVRREWSSLTQVERCRYINAIYIVSTQEPFKSCYEPFIKIHHDNFNSGVHEDLYFLPWHRWFLLSFENLLRRLDCKLTIPYWDWSAEAHTWHNSTFWASECAFGGNGMPVTTGPFRAGNWRQTPSATPPWGPLKRNFNNDNFGDCAMVALIQRQAAKDFTTWHTLMYGHLHSTVHCNIRGTMCSEQAANAPEFFLHHGMIDLIWATWQNKGPAYKNQEHYLNQTTALPGSNVTLARHMNDHVNQPGCVHICIQPTSRPCRTNTSYTPLCPKMMNCYEYSPKKLADLVIKPFSRVSDESNRVFGISPHKQKISDHFTELINSPDRLHRFLESNGYHVGSNSTASRPTKGELQFTRYLFQQNIFANSKMALNRTSYRCT